MMGPDVVYPVRQGDWNEELRYSLRSLANLPHNRVWVVGHKPPWLTGANHWPRPQTDGKYLNATKGLIEVAREIGTSLSDPFLLMNDDFYVMQPHDEMPVLHMGYVREVLDWYRKMRHTGAYWRGMLATYQLLLQLGIRDPLSYELHVPMPLHRDPLLEAWEKGKHLPVLHIRTLYGNLAQVGGTYMADCKVYRGRTKDWEGWPFLSSNDDVWVYPAFKALLRATFPEASPYESH